jgi:hypothetical protein
LTNGTIADATQVMANYNALTSCLANAAAAGNNTDITSLGGLTTPISPTQGGNSSLCGANGYKVINNAGAPNTALDITADWVLTTNSGRASVQRANFSATLNFATNGVNGLDTGALASASNYYIWIIDNGTTAAALGSLSPTSPTLPGGYTYSCRLSADYTATGAATLGQIVTVGRKTSILGTIQASFINNSILGNCTAGTFVAVTFAIPITASEMLVALTTLGTSKISPSPTGPGWVGSNPEGTGGNATYYASVPMKTAQTVYYCSNSVANGFGPVGWVDNTNAH